MRRTLTSCAVLFTLAACPSSPNREVTRPEAAKAPGAQPQTASTGTTSVTQARVNPLVVEQCRAALTTALPDIESAAKPARVALALRALGSCELLAAPIRDAARESASLNVDRRRVRLHSAVPQACRSPSAFDHGSQLPSGCAPGHVSASLLRNIDAPTCAFAAYVRRTLAQTGALDGPAKRVLDNLLLGAASPSGR